MINGTVIFNGTISHRNGAVFFVRLYYIFFIYFNKLFISIKKRGARVGA